MDGTQQAESAGKQEPAALGVTEADATVRWAAPTSAQTEQLLRLLREEQDRLAATLAGMGARLFSVEQQLLATSERIDLAAVHSRVPFLIAEPPRMARFSARAGAAVSSGAGAGVADDRCAAPAAEEVAWLRDRVEAVEAARTNDMEMLLKSLDAARVGIATIAQDLKKERTERRQLLGEVEQRVLGPTLDRATRLLRSDIVGTVEQSGAKLRVEVVAKVQLLLAELRGEVLQASHAATSSASNRGSPKALIEWLPQDVDGDISATKSMLEHLRVFDCDVFAGATDRDELIARPTTRFVHRVVRAIKLTTGFPQGVLQDWPGPADAKVDFINKVWERIAATLDLETEKFDPQDVLKCTNRQRTRRLLQLLALAAAKERGLQQQKRPISRVGSLPALPGP